MKNRYKFLIFIFILINYFLFIGNIDVKAEESISYVYSTSGKNESYDPNADSMTQDVYIFNYNIGNVSNTAENNQNTACLTSYSIYNSSDSITIPKTVKICYNDKNYILKVTEVGDGINSISKYGSSVSSLNLSNDTNLLKINNNAFKNFSNITKISSFPSTITYIGKSAFSGCSSLTQIGGTANTCIIPNTTVSIDENAFDGCNFTTVTVGTGISYIGKYAFANNALIKTITINAISDCEIDNYAFNGNTVLKTVTFGSSTTSNFTIRDNAFEKDTITKATINCSSLNDDISIFKDTKNLTTVTLPNILSIPNSMFENSSISTVSSLAKVTDIGNKAFKNCDNLKTLPNMINVQNIGEYAFSDCDNLTSLIFRTNKETTPLHISNYAFSNCFNLYKNDFIDFYTTFNDKSTIYNGTKNQYTGATKTYVYDNFDPKCSLSYLVNNPESITFVGISGSEDSHNYYTNTSVDKNRYIDYHGGAVYNGKLVDVRIYPYKITAPVYISKSVAWSFSSQTYSGQKGMEIHFYEYNHLGDENKEIEWAGIIKASDLDESEGWGVNKECLIDSFLSHSTKIKENNSNDENIVIYKGTVDNNNDKLKVDTKSSLTEGTLYSDKYNLYLEIKSSKEEPLILIYDARKSVGSKLGQNVGELIESQVFVNYEYVNLRNLNDFPNTSNISIPVNMYSNIDPDIYQSDSFEGYSFVGWFFDKECTQKVLGTEDVLKFVEKDITFYGYYKYDNFDIHFDSNSGNGIMEKQNIKYFENVTLNENKFTKQGYHFSKWNIKKDNSGKSFNDKVTYKFDLSFDEMTLYAQWEPNIYEIKLNNLEGLVEDSYNIYEKYSDGIYSSNKCLKEEFISKVQIPKKEDYIFKGYFTEENGLGTKYIDSDGTILFNNSTFLENVNLYASFVFNGLDVKCIDIGRIDDDEILLNELDSKVYKMDSLVKGSDWNNGSEDSLYKGYEYDSCSEITLTVDVEPIVYRYWNCKKFEVRCIDIDDEENILNDKLDSKVYNYGLIAKGSDWNNGNENSLYPMYSYSNCSIIEVMDDKELVVYRYFENNSSEKKYTIDEISSFSLLIPKKIELVKNKDNYYEANYDITMINSNISSSQAVIVSSSSEFYLYNEDDKEDFVLGYNDLDELTEGYNDTLTFIGNLENDIKKCYIRMSDYLHSGSWKTNISFDISLIGEPNKRTINIKNIAAKENVYNGEDQELIEEIIIDLGRIEYSLDKENWANDIPKAKDAGKYTVYFKVFDDKDKEIGIEEIESIIEKADSEITKDPEKKDIIFDDTEQELLIAGESNGSRIEYSLDKENWSENIPKAKDIGKYKIYYKVVENENYNASEIFEIEAEIKENNDDDISDNDVSGNNLTDDISDNNKIKPDDVSGNDLIDDVSGNDIPKSDDKSIDNNTTNSDGLDIFDDKTENKIEDKPIDNNISNTNNQNGLDKGEDNFDN